jgi:hypothetical protein
LSPSGILIGSEREAQKLQRSSGKNLADDQRRKEMARKRQENGISKKLK